MNNFIKEWVPYIAIIVIVILVRTYIVTPVIVRGDSMYNTLEDGEVLFLSKISYRLDDIKRFDIVVVEDIDNDLIIKRVIGIPGDSIEYKEGILYINDRKCDDKFASITENFDLTNFGIQKLPENSYFLLGDNRNNSIDSRIIGPVNIEKINGEVVFSLYPFNTFGKIEK